MRVLAPEQFFFWLQQANEDEIWTYIHNWHHQPETPQEIKQYVDYVLSQQSIIDPPVACLDCSGTGGDGSNTLNISTTAAIVGAAGGVSIAKHGARRTQGTAGSMDVLEALAIKISDNPQSIAEQLRSKRLAFIASKMSAELFLPIKKIVQQKRASSFLSFVGPLSNPVKITYQLLGVGKLEWVKRLAQTLELLERDRVLLVHGYSGSHRFDEITITGNTIIREMRWENKQKILDETYEIMPQQFGLATGKADELIGGTASENANRIMDILSGNKRSRCFDMVALNAGAIFYLYGKTATLKEGLDNAMELLRTGKCLDYVRSLQH